MGEFEPDYHFMIDAVSNRRPARMPVYEHIIAVEIMEQVLNIKIGLNGKHKSDFEEYYRRQCEFWKLMTYDTVNFEGCVTEIIPDTGAIIGGRPGPIQNRQDFEKFPFDELAERYWNTFTTHLDALRVVLPPGMKLHGGVGNGVFEISEDLVGYEYLCLLQYDDPELFRDLYLKIGDILVSLWTEMLAGYGDVFAVCRTGDDLGFKSATLLSPETINEHIVPQYRRIIDVVRGSGKVYLWHSCGNIFPVMNNMIAAGINAKHSNEDSIAPFEKWIDMYGERIGLLGGIDVGYLCSETPDTIRRLVKEKGLEYRGRANGFALGSGNSIPDYVPVENYLAMIEASREVRNMTLD